MTRHGGRLLAEEAFPPSHVEVEGHGNVLAGVAFLHGVASDELSARELGVRDPRYDLVVTYGDQGRVVSLARRVRWAARSRRAVGLVLVYHRVQRLRRDVWSLAVTPENFDEHLASSWLFAPSVP